MVGSIVDFGGPTQEVSEGNDVSNLAKGHFCGILAKNMAAFCPCHKNLPEVKLKHFGRVN